MKHLDQCVHKDNRKLAEEHQWQCDHGQPVTEVMPEVEFAFHTTELPFCQSNDAIASLLRVGLVPNRNALRL